MAGRKSDFTLTKLDDLFSTQEQRDDEKLSKIRDIPLTEIDDFPDHAFKVRDDEDMAQLIESIKERGVITPATVRQKEDGRYELISGHRRKRACELAGFDTLRCEVVDLNRDEATILMVESNYQRSKIFFLITLSPCTLVIATMPSIFMRTLTSLMKQTLRLTLLSS